MRQEIIISYMNLDDTIRNYSVSTIYWPHIITYQAISGFTDDREQ